MALLRARFFVLSALAVFSAVQCVDAQSLAWRKRFGSSALTLGINPLNPNTIYAEGSPGLLYASFDRGKSWNYIGSPGLSLFRQIIVHPSDTTVMFCAAAGSNLMKSTDAGATWHSVLSNFGIDGESVMYDPLHPDTMYAGNFGDGKVYRSSDRGDSWTLQGRAGTQLCAFTVRPDSSNILFGGTGGGQISKSTNEGVTWRVVKSGVGTRVFQEVPKIVVSPQNPLVAYATLNGNPDSTLGVWKTTDGGEHWTQTSLPKIATWGMAIDAGDQYAFYAGTFLDGMTSVFRSTDGGGSWTALSAGLPPAGAYLWSIKDHPLDTMGVWASITNDVFGYGGIYHLVPQRAEVDGAVLDAVTNDTVRNGIVRIPATGDSVNLAATRGTYSFGYYDGDPSLTPVADVEAYPYYIGHPGITFTPGTTGHQDLVLTPLPQSTISGVLENSLGHPIHASITLTTTSVSGSVAAVESTDASGHFSFPNRTIVYPPIVSDYSLFADPELPFMQLHVQPLHLDTAGIALSLVTSPADVFLVGEDSSGFAQYFQGALDSLHLSANLWNTVTKGPAPVPEGSRFLKKMVIYFTGTKRTPIAARELDSLDAALSAGCNLFVTGQNIVELNDSSAFVRRDVGIDFGGNTGIVYAKGIAGDLFDGFGFFTTGSGANDQTSSDILTKISLKTIPVLAYGGTGAGGTAAVRVDSAGARGKVVFMGFGFEAINTAQTRAQVMQRVISYLDGSFVLGVGEKKGTIPASFALSQNYPNPFNPETRLRYDLPREGRVILTVYDLLGREVAVLVDEEKTPGSYTAIWNAAGLSSGVYFSRLVVIGRDGAEIFRADRKLVVMR